jgi:2-iminobutanoate/2-iminopropanoate deaminase
VDKSDHSSDKQYVPVPEVLLDSIDGLPTWSDAVRVGNHVYCTGQVGWDKKTGRIVDGDFEAEAQKALENVRDLLAQAGADLEDVVIVRVYLKRTADYAAFDRVYARFFSSHQPARVTVVVADLIDPGSNVDVEAHAIIR